MCQDSVNPPLLSLQGRNPTWGRPVRRNHQLRSPSSSCSSRPSGRWRTSFTSLHWSSSSSSGHMLSEKRTGSSTCWRKISSTRRSTPKTKGTCVCRVLRGRSVQAGTETSRNVRLMDYQWMFLGCMSAWERHVELWNNLWLTGRVVCQ